MNRNDSLSAPSPLVGQNGEGITISEEACPDRHGHLHTAYSIWLRYIEEGNLSCRAQDIRDGDLFVISNGVVPGDSGAPVLSLRDGTPEWVGLVQGTLGSTRIGWAIKINPILKTLSKHPNNREFSVVEKASSPLL